MSEHQEQMALIQWANLNLKKYPELKLLFAIPNGGQRSSVAGARLKDEGVKRGVSDLCLPVARKGYHAFYIEMKRRGGGAVSPYQKKWIENMKEQGNKAIVAYGFIEAKNALIEYLEGAE